MRKVKFKIVKKINNRSVIINGNSPFCLIYEKDKKVMAPKGTLGVMVFDRKLQAEKWLNLYTWWNIHDEDMPYKIKRVVPIGRGIHPYAISKGVRTEGLRGFYNEFNKYGFTYMKDHHYRNAPYGTCCYPGVHVLD